MIIKSIKQFFFLFVCMISMHQELLYGENVSLHTYEEKLELHLHALQHKILLFNEECWCEFNCPYTFSHVSVEECAILLKMYHSLDPLLSEWQTETNKDEPYIQDVALLVASLYDALAQQQHKVSVFNLIGLYMEVSHLPIVQLLEALDAMATQLELVVDHYPLERPFTWSAWLERYWWVPTFGSMLCFYTAIKWYQNKK